MSELVGAFDEPICGGEQMLGKGAHELVMALGDYWWVGEYDHCTCCRNGYRSWGQPTDRAWHESDCPVPAIEALRTGR